MYRVEDLLHAHTDGIQFVRSNVLYAADVAAAEGVDDGIKAVAGVVVGGRIDLVARFGADAAVLVVAVREGEAADLGGGCGARLPDGRLGAAFGWSEMGRDTKVKERPAEGGVGMRIEIDARYGAQLGGASD